MSAGEAPAGSARVATGAERPDSLVDTISVEGMPQPTTLRLFRAPASFPLAFSTYLPADVREVPATSPDGEAVRFEAHFGGRPRPEIYAQVVALPAGLSADEARERGRRAAAALGEPRSGPGAVHPWALEGVAYRGAGGVIGRVEVGSHAGRHFYLLTHLPAEAADGFGPRLATILERWRWNDTGAGLAGG